MFLRKFPPHLSSHCKFRGPRKKGNPNQKINCGMKMRSCYLEGKKKEIGIGPKIRRPTEKEGGEGGYWQGWIKIAGRNYKLVLKMK
jgi:hypothetical protein